MIDERLRAAIRHACADETDGRPNGDIIVKGCIATQYVDPEDAAARFVDGIVDAVLSTLSLGTRLRLGDGTEAVVVSKGLVDALTECVDTLALCEHPASVDPRHGVAIDALGRRIGFGALMASASASWRQLLIEQGLRSGGEFVAGPCQSTVTNALTQARAMLSALETK
jgi:hypothetical protein